MSSGRPALANRLARRQPGGGGAIATAALPADVRLMRATANLLFTLAALAWLTLAGNLLIRQPAFALRAIRIEGDVARNSEASIRANAVPKLSGNFFTADLTAVRRAFESVPWVRRAEVRRVWPNRLVVRLEEHRAAAVWDDEVAGDRLVNTAGELFEANVGEIAEADGGASGGGSDANALPVLAGPAGSSAHTLALLERLQPVLARVGKGAVRIERLAQSSRGSWRAELDNGAVLELGRGSDAELLARGERFVSTLPQVTQHFQRPLEYADLRHPDGYAVRLAGVTTLIDEAASAPKARPAAPAAAARKPPANAVPTARPAARPAAAASAVRPLARPAAPASAAPLNKKN